MSTGPAAMKQSGWNSASIGKAWQHRFFYALIGLGGRRLAYVFVKFVVMWYLIFYPPARQRCQPYLIRRFPRQRHFIKRFLASYQWLITLGESLVDRAAFGISRSSPLRIEVPNRACLQQELLQGRGLIVLGAHTGCWQIAFSSLQFLQKKVHIVMYRDRADIDRHYYEHQGQAPPFEVIDPGGYLGGVVQMAAVLQQGDILGLMGDRVFGDEANTVAVNFLGGTIRLPVAAFRLAAMQSTPIAVVFVHKSSASQYTVEVAGVITVPQQTDRRPESYLPYARDYARLLEQFVQDHPYDFFNFHPMWEN